MPYDGFDDNDDPYQFGIHGWEVESDGLTRMKGPALGIVLSVELADSDSNFMYKLLQSDKSSSSQGSQLEAHVLLIYDGKEIFQEINHVLILQGKCSQDGPGDKEPSDWTEDVPNGCKDSELKEFYADGGRTDIQNLSGDWVIVDFIGGILQLPMITRWFPNPNNNRDAATKLLGKRFILRRNNSEISISNDGDFHITHRDGQYIQMKNQKITIKHRQGQIIHMDQDGKVFISNSDGNHITIDDDGITMVAGEAMTAIEMSSEGGMAHKAFGGDLDLSSSESINITSPYVTIGSGVSETGTVDAEPLCTEGMAYDFRTSFSALYGIVVILASLPDPVGTAFKTYIATSGMGTLAVKMGLNPLDGQALPTSDSQIAANYLTKVLLGE